MWILTDRKEKIKVDRYTFAPQSLSLPPKAWSSAHKWELAFQLGDVKLQEGEKRQFEGPLHLDNMLFLPLCLRSCDT